MIKTKFIYLARSQNEIINFCKYVQVCLIVSVIKIIGIFIFRLIIINNDNNYVIFY